MAEMFVSRIKNFDKLSSILNKYGIHKKDMCIVGSSVLCLWGIRENNDIDFVIDTKAKETLLRKFKGELNFSEDGYVIRFSKEFEAIIDKYENIGISDTDLVNNTQYHISNNGYKFARIEIEYAHKIKRNEKKDVNDLKSLEEFSSSYPCFDWDFFRKCRSFKPYSFISRLKKKFYDSLFYENLEENDFREDRGIVEEGEKITQNLWNIFNKTFEMVKHSDSKAVSLLNAYLIFFSGLLIFIISNESNANKFYNYLFSLSIISFAGILAILMILATIISIYYVLSVISPVLTKPKPLSLIYFGSVQAFKDSASYYQEVESTFSDIEKLNEQISHEIYVNSIVAQKKFLCFKKSIICFGTALVLLLINICYYIICFKNLKNLTLLNINWAGNILC